MNLDYIGFIPDGNRRYAKLNGLSLLNAYHSGTSKAWDVINWLSDYKQIKGGIFYTLSLKNLQRDKAELSVLYKIFENELKKAKNSNFLHDKDISLNFIGRLDLLPSKLQIKMKEMELETQNNKKQVQLALGYDGQQEILDAVKSFPNGTDFSKISKEEFEEKLYTNIKPDLIVRTSGESRLSGFLSYQSAYSELYFTDKLWPEFDKQELNQAIETYNARSRRLGK